MRQLVALIILFYPFMLSNVSFLVSPLLASSLCSFIPHPLLHPESNKHASMRASTHAHAHTPKTLSIHCSSSLGPLLCHQSLISVYKALSV